MGKLTKEEKDALGRFEIKIIRLIAACNFYGVVNHVKVDELKDVLRKNFEFELQALALTADWLVRADVYAGTTKGAVKMQFDTGEGITTINFIEDIWEAKFGPSSEL